MKIQDGAGSSKELKYDKDFKRKPQEKTVMSKSIDEDPSSVSPRPDPLKDFFNTAEFPVDMNADDAEMLFKAYMAKLGAGLRV